MRFTSLIIELIRARPRLVVWVVLLVQAAIWLLLPMILFGGPPESVATTIVAGRDYALGTPSGPPLAFWLADLAFRAAGQHILGVYLLAQVCFLLTFLWLYQLGRAIVGGPHAVLAVLLTLTVLSFSLPGVAFGPEILARPIWALLLLQTWKVMGQRRRQAWAMLAIAAGLLVLTTAAAPALLALVAITMLSTARGRRQLASLDLLYAVLAIAVIVCPYAIWLLRHNFAGLWPGWPAIGDWRIAAQSSAALFGGLLFLCTGAIVLIMMNTARLNRVLRAPMIARAGVDPDGRRFVLILASVPPIAACVIAGLYGWEQVAGGAGIVLLMTGLAVVVIAGDQIALRQHRLLRKVWAVAVIAPAIFAASVVLVQPWIIDGDSAITLPGKSMAQFFKENFERRTGQTFAAVGGDPQLAALMTLSPTRPVLIDRAEAAMARGAVVIWWATDTKGTPPPDVAQRFPGLVPEVPRGFDRLVNGRQPPLRIGWAIIRPKTS
jgi:4-amino-4-deoxy-L-arabinose transferase-like glycosyltransferase